MGNNRSFVVSFDKTDHIIEHLPLGRVVIQQHIGISINDPDNVMQQLNLSGPHRLLTAELGDQVVLFHPFIRLIGQQ